MTARSRSSAGLPGSASCSAIAIMVTAAVYVRIEFERCADLCCDIRREYARSARLSSAGTPQILRVW